MKRSAKVCCHFVIAKWRYADIQVSSLLSRGLWRLSLLGRRYVKFWG